MPDTILDRIINNVVAALNTITVKDGFNYDLVAERWKEGGNPTSSDAYAVVQEFECPLTPEMSPSITRDCYTVTVNIFFRVTSDDSSHPGSRINRLEGDIRKICRINEQWGGLAYMTDPQPSKPYAVYELPGRGLPLKIIFVTKRDDPFTQ